MELLWNRMNVLDRPIVISHKTVKLLICENTGPKRRLPWTSKDDTISGLSCDRAKFRLHI